MACACKIAQLEATIGSTFLLQFRLKEDDGTVIDITGMRFVMQAKSKDGATLFAADSSGQIPKITLDDEDGATVSVLVPESTAPQLADFDVLMIQGQVITPIIRGMINLLPQITDATP